MPTHATPGLLPYRLTDEQAKLVEAPVGDPQSLFLEGPAGSGKTTAGVARLLRLLAAGVPGDAILVLVPQRTLGRRYLEAVRSSLSPPGARVDVLTIGGLARRAVELYWPLVGGPAGFAHPEQPPVFLTLETAQYYMDRLVEPFIQSGAFGEVTLSRQRLISQILDNLNKAAVVGFPYREIGERLSRAWSGESGRLQVYARVQECAEAFRRFCLGHNLLDFSLQIEVFVRYVLPLPEAAAGLHGRYRHLLVDNVEEDVPVTHDLLAGWLPGCGSAWVIYDEDGGLRTYLGADPRDAYALRQRCREHVRFGQPIRGEAALLGLAAGIAQSLNLSQPTVAPDPRPALCLLGETFHTETVRTVARTIGELVHDKGVAPQEIAVLAPFMGDALRFELATALARQGIAAYSERPSRALRDEPAVRCLLTLAKLAHPSWRMLPDPADVAHALVSAVEQMDLVRAWHLSAIVYRRSEGYPALASFEQIRPEEQLKITYLLGNRYEALRAWLAAYAEGPALPFDHFLGRLFDEVLSRPGYVFQRDRDSAAATAHLIESARAFRQTLGGEEPFTATSFVSMVEQGVLAAQYLHPAPDPPQAVLLAPAYTFVMGDRPVDIQFWLDLSSPSWGRRLYQPLTHPYVLTRHWPPEQRWTDADEDQANREALFRLTIGLIRRCRQRIYLADSTYSERGLEQRGLLQQAIFRTLRRAARLAPPPGATHPLPGGRGQGEGRHPTDRALPPAPGGRGQGEGGEEGGRD